MSTSRQRRHILFISSSLTVMLFLITIFRSGGNNYQELDYSYDAPERRISSKVEDGTSTQMVEDAPVVEKKSEETHEATQDSITSVQSPKISSKKPISLQPPKISTVKKLEIQEKETTRSSHDRKSSADKQLNELRSFLSNRVQRKIRLDFSKVPADFDFVPGSPIDVAKTRKVLLLSTFRSGSTFTGELLSSYPGSFYSFEPFHELLRNQHYQEGSLDASIQDLIRGIMTCSFDQHRDYLQSLSHTYFAKFNTYLWGACARKQALCYDPEFVSNVCHHLPLNIMKTARLGLKPVRALMEDPSLDLRVIHLVRDPRGTMNSRYAIKWCKSQSCVDPVTVCNDLTEDLNLSEEFSHRFPDRYMFVRYEDVSLETAAVSKRIFDFLGLSPNRFVEKFVAEHSSARQANHDGKYTTFRNSSRVTFAWREVLSFQQVEKIQKPCLEPLQRLGYRIFSNEQEYRNSTLSVI